MRFPNGCDRCRVMADVDFDVTDSPGTLCGMYEHVSDLTYFRMLVSDASKIPLFEAAAAIAVGTSIPGLIWRTSCRAWIVLGKRLAERCRDAGTEASRLREATAFFFTRAGFCRQRQRLLRPGQQLHPQGARDPARHSDFAGRHFVELASVVGLEADGISFPGHFLIKVNLHEGPVVLDPFTGYSLSQEDILERLDPYRLRLGLVGDMDVPTGLFLQAATPREILLRMLRNLREIYKENGQVGKLRRVLDRILILDPEDQDEIALRASLGGS